MINDGIAPRIQPERERRGEREGGEEEHLERDHAEAGRRDVRDHALRTPALTSSTHRLPTVTDRFQKLMITPFIDGGAWL